jgi:hypothetical protein
MPVEEALKLQRAVPSDCQGSIRGHRSEPVVRDHRVPRASEMTSTIVELVDASPWAPTRSIATTPPTDEGDADHRKNFCALGTTA